MLMAPGGKPTSAASWAGRQRHQDQQREVMLEAAVLQRPRERRGSVLHTLDACQEEVAPAALDPLIGKK